MLHADASGAHKQLLISTANAGAIDLNEWLPLYHHHKWPNGFMARLLFRPELPAGISQLEADGQAQSWIARAGLRWVLEDALTGYFGGQALGLANWFFEQFYRWVHLPLIDSMLTNDERVRRQSSRG